VAGAVYPFIFGATMNLKALREKVKNITDYSPDLQQFNDQLDELLNDAYYQLWTTKRWTFATQIGFIGFQPDITPTTDTEYNAGVALTANITNGDRRVVFSASIGRLADKQFWEGCPIELNDNEYIISRIDSLTEVLLTETYKGDSTPTSSNWKIKKRYYDLPEDCAELLYFGMRDYPYNTNAGTVPPWGKGAGLMPRMDEAIALRADYDADYPECYIPAPTIRIPAAENIDFELGSGTLPAGYYEFAWAFVKEGKVSALSEAGVFQIQETGGIIVKFLGWDDKYIQSDAYQSNDQVAPQWEGYRKVLYYNKNFNQSTGERKGLPCWLQVTKGGTRNTSIYLEPIEAADTFTSVAITELTQLDNGSARYIEIDGTHQQIRPYPRVTGFDEKIVKTNQFTRYIRQAVIRYYKKPKDLLLDTDSPEMPFEFHQLIVYKALEEIYLKLGAQSLAMTYKQRYDKDIKQLQRRYVDKIDFMVQRGQFGTPSGHAWYQMNSLRYTP
jgi:hypothetical protein